MRIEQDIKLDFKDVLIRPKRSTLTSRSEVDISRDFVFLHSQRKYRGIPIIAANMDTTGTFDMARALAGHQLSVALHKYYSEDELLDYFSGLTTPAVSFYSMGITAPDYEKFQRVKEGAGAAIEYVCVDVANGYTKAFVGFIHKLRTAYPDITLMAGNVVTGEMTEELILDGVDIVKVGIGPGSVCTTRRMSGVGYPQLSAIIECADAAHGLHGLICADGGCTSPGDLAKAFGAGADFVMLGGMLAGHDECGSEVVEQNGVLKMRFYGMSSREAMEKYAGGVAEYRAAEGKDILLDYRGPVENTVQEILGGVRSACTYVGARKLKELSKRTTFIRVTQQLNEIFGPQ
ncbi:GMP reductase [Propionivibrio sp.]|uniref:GMP reductase n=1 Tax=Propionivibrio sp. TaxID=2212460 RepID=UPI0025EC6A9F|nr:GMP reductase [Propionivibrio sp.]MBK7356700.1 GMP reductase [Propionivibrio sp.]MBK8401118.1 GMP reductase [Propionivibrio sp.]MBK8744280.1 GMP reductase [Propionivibrio sp.]MBK8894887.1 GMP reductase [Propionivibrio sp.]MBL0208438.1 GMP reductase [Propionivibrio sp.]